MSSDSFSFEQVRLGRDVIEAVGSETERFLQGQLSQDVVALAPGASAHSLLLAPQGKVDAFLRVTCTAADRYLLDVDAGWGPAVMARLQRFKLRTKCQLTLLEGWVCWAVRGDPAAALPVPEPAVIAADAGWPVLVGFDRLGPELPAQSSVPVVDTVRYDDWRVAAGVAAMGTELDEHTIPAEAGRWLIERAVSFTKGCYTGQELVARVDSRGSNTPRHLRRLVVDGPLADLRNPLVAGGVLRLDGAEVGVLTTASSHGASALGYCKRAVEPGALLEAATSGVVVRVEALPVAAS